MKLNFTGWVMNWDILAIFLIMPGNIKALVVFTTRLLLLRFILGRRPCLKRAFFSSLIMAGMTIQKAVLWLKTLFIKTTGARGILNPKTTGVVKFGYSDRDYKGFNDKTTTTIKADVDYKFSPLTLFYLRTTRGIT